MSDKEFIRRIKRLEKLTPSEKKIADFFSRCYNDLIFENLTTISEKTSLSKPTVLRFISKLGFKRFADFKDALRKELAITHDTLHIRYSIKKKLLEDSEEDVIAQNFTNSIKNLESTYDQIDKQQFMIMAKTIAQAVGKIYICGQRSSYALAYMFENMIRRVLPNTTLIKNSCVTEPDILMNVCEKDLLFSVFRHPYGAQTKKIIQFFKERGAKVLVLTDSEINPAAKLIDHQLVINTEGVSVFTSSTSILAILEALNIAVLGFCESDISKRLERAEQIYDFFGTFCS
jgi:DNA-binding MurR/RpiR family transcriptional regulator